ncbi:hypothetical protein METBIDRAFT_173349 [Metschnikowia bicuspidata var. bicuspidata NRRL YB-4993]|uniref:Uncharacterized protein n=1 Tax=Metschnikowia bicuspidata var. bicuspidata NRRL YB-4993 TaxID=869754 RepID=A0A1A0HAP2_9ASCO|nr:hypothetical protein METBIDRAFT_173349 [Metschnikowia bicuspidata var. bicuspidata NRRL YB-4993]OBA21070.1 hypothetical protein METBIDRAFT_173349 [Metschnikowia bicuspidata var. bicuspidata NRRL YB-4993]
MTSSARRPERRRSRMASLPGGPRQTHGGAVPVACCARPSARTVLESSPGVPAGRSQGGLGAVARGTGGFGEAGRFCMGVRGTRCPVRPTVWERGLLLPFFLERHSRESPVRDCSIEERMASKAGLPTAAWCSGCQQVHGRMVLPTQRKQGGIFHLRNACQAGTHRDEHTETYPGRNGATQDTRKTEHVLTARVGPMAWRAYAWSSLASRMRFVCLMCSSLLCSPAPVILLSLAILLLDCTMRFSHEDAGSHIAWTADYCLKMGVFWSCTIFQTQLVCYPLDAVLLEPTSMYCISHCQAVGALVPLPDVHMFSFSFSALARDINTFSFSFSASARDINTFSFLI